MKIVQLHPKKPAPDERASGFESETDDATKGDASPAREPDGEPSSENTAQGDVVQRRQIVRKTVITIKRRKIRRAPAPSPAEILARSLDGPRLKAGWIAQTPPLEAPRDRPAGPVVQPSAPEKPDGASDGDPFWQIWLGHRNYLRAHALRFAGGNFADAEDALSEAMLKAAQTFESSTIHNHRAWLLRLVHNACMDRHRSDRRRSRLAKDITDTDAQTAPAVAIRPGRSPEELLCVLQQIDDLQRAMTELPSFLAEPFLRYLDDQSDAEIADSLHVTKEVIRKRRQIVRAMLRRCLSP